MPNYSYLKTDLINTTENDSTEFATQVSTIIYKTELRMVKDLDDAGLDEYTTISVSSGNAGTVSLSDRARIVRNVNYKVSTGTTITNLTGQAYRDTSSPHEVDPATNDESTSGSVISNNNYTYSDMDGSTTFLNSGTPLVNTGVGGAYTLGTIAVPITGSSVRSVQTIKARTKNVNGQGSYSTGSTKIQVHTASPNGVVEDAIPVDDSLGNGSTHTDDGKRITGFGAASDTPSFTGSTNYYTANAWSGSVTVAGTSEAITRLSLIHI